MRDYQPKKNNPYTLPRDEWNQTIWFIRGYERRAEEADALLENSPAPLDGLPSGSVVPDSTTSAAVRREKLLDANRMIDKALKALPEEYRNGVWESVMYGKRYPRDVAGITHSYRTWSKYKSLFVWIVYGELQK